MTVAKLLDITSEATIGSALSNTLSASMLSEIVALLQNETIKHGDFSRWRSAVESLPSLPAQPGIVDDDHWLIETEKPTAQQHEQLEQSLRGLMPWRKGPYKIGPITIDTEWRSGWKWNRLIDHISPLEGRDVLDIGCGNGYHLWRMHEAGARTALGVEPSLLFNLQFKAIQHYSNISSVAMLPLSFEQLPNSDAFDTVFSMGVLYHRKSPNEHLTRLFRSLKPGGELVLETLIAPGEEDNELTIDKRYAGMRNLYQLPSVLRVIRWMEEEAFTDIRCVSVDVTSVFEQRSTDWMTYHSLANALDPEDKTKTVEGLPRPRRAILIANRPETRNCD